MKQYAPGKEPDYIREEKLTPSEIEVRGGFLGWLDNFWFYHKWKLLAGVALVLLLAICTVQMCGNVSDDLTIMYAGSAYLPTDPNYANMLGAFESVMSDFNGDGEKHAALAALNIYSEEQIKAREGNEISGDEVNTQINTQEYNSYLRVMQTGEYSVCLLERWLYDVVAKGVFCKLSDVLGETPDYAVDDYCVNFWDTDFAKANAEAFASVPKDTVLCLRTKNALSGKSNEEQFERSKATFIAIMNYKAE